MEFGRVVVVDNRAEYEEDRDIGFVLVPDEVPWDPALVLLLGSMDDQLGNTRPRVLFWAEARRLAWSLGEKPVHIFDKVRLHRVLFTAPDYKRCFNEQLAASLGPVIIRQAVQHDPEWYGGDRQLPSAKADGLRQR